jgi:ankyrin repeat protein
MTMVGGLGARTPLHWAAASNNVGRLRELVATPEVNIESRDRMGYTALHVAVQGWNLEAAEVLLGAGANVEAETTQGASALMLAVNNSRGRCELLDLLRRYGADPRHPDRAGHTPASIGHSYGNPALDRVLDTASR